MAVEISLDEPAAARANLSAAWWAVVVRFLLHGMIISTWVSRIPGIQEGLGLSNGVLGLCLLGTAIGCIVSVPVTGWLITRFGSKRVTTWSTVWFCVALIAPSLAVNAPTLFLALLLYGAGAAANDVSMNAQAVAVEDAMATPTMSRLHAMFSIGGMLGAGLGGLVAAHNITPKIHLLIAAGAFLALATSTGHLLLDAEDHVREGTKLPALTSLPAVLITLTVIGFCLFLSEGAMADWIAVYLKQTLHTNAGWAAAGYAFFSAGMALFRLFGDMVTKHLGAVRTVRAGALLAVSGLSLALTTTSAAWALAGFALTGAGCSVIVPLVFAASGRVRSIPSAVGVAMVSGSGYIGFLFGPPLIGFVAQLSSLRVGLSLLIGLCLAAALFAPAVREVTE